MFMKCKNIKPKPLKTKEREIKMCIVKTQKINNITVNIHDDYIPKTQEEYKNNLKTVYDTINLIFQNKNKGNLFYTNEELEKTKKDNICEFI